MVRGAADRGSGSGDQMLPAWSQRFLSPMVTQDSSSRKLDQKCRDRSILSILDAKRGDISSTMKAYGSAVPII